ncbi:MAG: HD-GYP domain-containing protein [Thermoleophilia bacterium]|nr:HD-GYP domain-containing protein [Thermoleophilia bacterium]
MAGRDASEAPSRPRTTDEDRLAEALVRDAEHMTGAERRVEAGAGAAFLLAAAAVAVLFPTQPVADWWQLAIAVGMMALAAHVRFAIPSGYTVPIMLVSVPVLFLVPPGLFPAVTAAALVVGGLPDVLRGRAAADRMLLALPNAWYSVGPAVVFGLAGPMSSHAPDVPVLLLALVAQIACDLAASAIRETFLGGPSLREQIRESDWVYLVDVALAPVGFALAVAAEHRAWTLMLIAPLLLLLHAFAAERRQRLEQLVELSNAYRGTAMVLGDVIESDDEYTGEHCKSVVALALAVADSLGLDAAQRRRVEFGALLHDVGKVAIPKEIINKRGPLDAAEWEIIKTHTTEGQRMLDTVGGIMSDVGRIVRAHHERWDGTGYPDGLAADAIPVESRIVAACDTWHAMTSSRSYREAMAFHVALAELRSVSGSQLDPVVVSVLARLVTEEHDAARAVRGPRRVEAPAEAVAEAAATSVDPPAGEPAG